MYMRKLSACPAYISNENTVMKCIELQALAADVPIAQVPVINPMRKTSVGVFNVGKIRHSANRMMVVEATFLFALELFVAPVEWTARRDATLL